jgi:hypothetical protein
MNKAYPLVFGAGMVTTIVLFLLILGLLNNL